MYMCVRARVYVTLYRIYLEITDTYFIDKRRKSQELDGSFESFTLESDFLIVKMFR